MSLFQDMDLGEMGPDFQSTVSLVVAGLTKLEMFGVSKSMQ